MNLDLLKTELIHDEVMYLDPFNNARGNRAVGVSRDLDINPLTPEEEAVVGHDGRSKSISAARRRTCSMPTSRGRSLTSIGCCPGGAYSTRCVAGH